MEPIPQFVREYAEHLRPGGDRAAGLAGVLHYLRSAERAAESAPLVVPLLPAALATAPDVEEPEAVGKALARLGPAGVPLLADLARSPHCGLREAAAVAVSEAGAAAAGAATGVTRLLTDDVPAVRAAACRALPAARPDRESVRLLRERIADPDEDVALAAVEQLGLLGEAAEAAVPALLPAIGPTADPARRLAALRAVARIGLPPADRERVRHVVRRDWAGPAADDLAAALELEAVLAMLYRLGSAAEDFAPDLEAVLAAGAGLFDGRRAQVAGVLLRMNPRHAAAERVLRGLAASGDPARRAYAGAELGSAAPAVRTRLTDLIGRLNADPEEAVRDAVAPLAGR